MPIRITAGATNVTASGNQLIMQLPTSWEPPHGTLVAVDQLSIYYSWRNITAAKNNNTFTYRVNGSTFLVVMPDGYYAFSDLNAYLQQVMFTNGHYLLDNAGTPQYYLSWVVNPTYYALSLTATIIPSSLPSGWANPASLTLSGTCPQVIVPSTNFATYTGFVAGTYPATNATTQVVTGGVPAVVDITGVNVCANFAQDNRGLSSNAQNIAYFSPTEGAAVYGGQITYRPQNLQWVSAAGSYNQLIITFYDQLYRALPILDYTGLTISLRTP